MRIQYIATFLLCILLAGCNSAENDGKTQANEERAMWEKYVQEQLDCYNDFIKGFDPSGYHTRTEAIEALNERINQVETNFSQRHDELDAKWTAILEKYSDDPEKLSSMHNAYNSIIDNYQMDTTTVAALRAQAYKKISTIIPSAPDQSRISQDLVGRTVKSLPGGYLNEFWTWTIERGDIHDFNICEVTDNDSQNKEYTVEFTLQRKGGAYKVRGKAYYTIVGRDDWELDLFCPQEIEVVKTGRYDNAISSGIVEYFVGSWLRIDNKSDATLLVGYTVIDSHGISKRFSQVIKGGETVTHQMLSLKDYTIDFVERP